VANGLDAGQIIDIGTLPNHAMGRVLQEMDVALFPNRCEGGTNLVAMECMACSLPTIVSANTGHLDLVANRCALCPETRQNPLPVATETAIGTDGWGESDVEEIVETLEQIWSDRESARMRGLAGVESLHRWSWRNQIRELHDVLKAISP